MVSVIIPTYNRETCVLDSVNSVLEQTYADIELIVVDDCSTDNTEELLNKISDKRFKYIRHVKNQGACAARNTGIDAAQGEYIAFQDSDDVWVSNKLELQMDALLANNADVVFCAMRRFGYGKDCVDVFPKGESGFRTHEDIIMGGYVSTQTILGKRKVFEKNKFDRSLPRLQDYDLMIRVSETEKVFFLNKSLVDVYLQADSITSQPRQAVKRGEVAEYLLQKYPVIANRYPAWHVKMLNMIAYKKVLSDEDARGEYKMIYTLSPSGKNLLKYFLSKIGLIKRFIETKMNEH